MGCGSFRVRVSHDLRRNTLYPTLLLAFPELRRRAQTIFSAALFGSLTLSPRLHEPPTGRVQHVVGPVHSQHYLLYATRTPQLISGAVHVQQPRLQQQQGVEGRNRGYVMKDTAAFIWGIWFTQGIIRRGARSAQHAFQVIFIKVNDILSTVLHIELCTLITPRVSISYPSNRRSEAASTQMRAIKLSVFFPQQMSCTVSHDHRDICSEHSHSTGPMSSAFKCGLKYGIHVTSPCDAVMDATDLGGSLSS